MTRWLSWIPPRLRPLAGLSALLLWAWISIYGKLGSFERFEAQRFTSRAILTGTLHMRSVVGLAQHDEQIYNGAVYTNWGFGVPLLQAPFHALASVLPFGNGFFPDRGIFYVYLALLVPALWAALDRVLRGHPSWEATPGARLAVSWSATWLVLCVTVFPFMSTRFVVFEDTIATMVVCELFALAAYVGATRSPHPGWIALVGAAAGLGLLVRPTGLVHLGVWGAVVLFGGVGMTRVPVVRRTAVFLASAAPFVAFWLVSNRVRTGSPLGLGFDNSNPAWSYGTPMQRFGSPCIDGVRHGAEALGRLLWGFFIWVKPHEPPSTWLGQCHFDLEERDGTREPFFGPVILALLVWILGRHLRRRERRLAVYVPYAAMLLLVASFLHAGAGFAWRYAGDFWPVIVLACVMAVQAAREGERPVLTPRLAKFLFWGGFAYCARFLIPWGWFDRPELTPPDKVATMTQDFLASRWGKDDPVPSDRMCASPPTTLYNDRLGWDATCAVDTFTNLYLGVLPRTDGRYRLHLATEGIEAPRVRVYLNGRIYVAERAADGYDTDVRIDYGALTSPIVLATVEWAPVTARPAGRLLRVTLT